MSLAEFPARLRAAIGTQPVNKYAKASGVAESVVRSYLTGRSRPGLDKLFDLARGANVRVEWLATGEGPMRLGTETAEQQPCQSHLDHISIPRLSSRSESGAGKIEFESVIFKNIALKEEWLKIHLGIEPGNLAMFNAEGDSMAPTIQDGDFLILDLSQTDIGDAIYALRHGESILIRRVQRIPNGTVRVMGDNKKVEPIDVDPRIEGSFIVLGRVVWLGRTLYRPDKKLP